MTLARDPFPPRSSPASANHLEPELRLMESSITDSESFCETASFGVSVALHVQVAIIFQQLQNPQHAPVLASQDDIAGSSVALY